MRKKFVTLILIFVMTVPMLSGCWDRVEIEQRATVLGLALDIPEADDANQSLDVTHPPDKAKSVKPQILVTADIAVPGQISLGADSGGGGSTSTEKAVWTVRAVGVDIDAALTNLQQKVAETLFLGHLRVIIVSKDVAKRGLEDVNDYFRRDPEIRRTTWMMVSKERAASVMSVTPPLARVPTLYILATMDRAKDMGKIPNDFAGVFWTRVSSDGQEGTLPYVSREDKQNIKVEGLACFREDSLVTTSSPFEIMSFMEILGENPAGYTVPIAIDDGRVTVSAFRRLAHIRTSIKNGVPIADVAIHIDANISEKDKGYFDLQNPQTIQSIKRELNTELTESCLKFIEKTQKEGTDIFGFGEHIRATHPIYWKKNIGTKQKWEQEYAKLKVRIHATSRIHRLGMKTT